jgi:hypothetical protein
MLSKDVQCESYDFISGYTTALQLMPSALLGGAGHALSGRKSPCAGRFKVT